MHLFEETLKSEEIYKGVVVKLYKDTALLENGEQATREVIRHPGGVCIAALTEDGCLLFVKQFRYPHGKVLVELPAGKLEWGESPLDCGMRELTEETGYTAKEFTYLGNLLPTPAYDNEVIHMYLAKGLEKSQQQLDEDEFLDVDKIPLDDAVKMIMDGEINDAKTQIAVLKVKLMAKNA